MADASTWLKLADEDIHWAKASLKENVLRGACFAAQQGAEKALKAFLLSKDVQTPKIHDLIALNAKCENLDKEFRDLEKSCSILSPYYLSSRYPDIVQFEQYSQKMAKEAVSQAEKIVDFVKSKIMASAAGY